MGVSVSIRIIMMARLAVLLAVFGPTASLLSPEPRPERPGGRPNPGVRADRDGAASRSSLTSPSKVSPQDSFAEFASEESDEDEEHRLVLCSGVLSQLVGLNPVRGPGWFRGPLPRRMVVSRLFLVHHRLVC